MPPSATDRRTIALVDRLMEAAPTDDDRRALLHAYQLSVTTRSKKVHPFNVKDVAYNASVAEDQALVAVGVLEQWDLVRRDDSRGLRGRHWRGKPLRNDKITLDNLQRLGVSVE